MEKLFLYSLIILTALTLSSESQYLDGRQRHRSKARHILHANTGRLRIHSQNTQSSTILPQIYTLLSTSPTPVARPSTLTTPATTSSSTQSSSRRSIGSYPNIRRGSDIYNGGDWDEISRRLGNSPLTDNPIPGSNLGSNQDRINLLNSDSQQNQQGQSTPQGQTNPQWDTTHQSQGFQDHGNGQSHNVPHGQRPSRRGRVTGSPFYSKMSAFDYLTRRGNGNMLQNANTRRNRELNRVMGEGMCEAFGKHYVPISIGGKCV